MAKRGGIGILLCVAVIALAMQTPPGPWPGGHHDTLWTAADWLFLVGIATAGGLTLAAADDRLRLPALVTGVTCASQLAGMGLYVVKHSGQAVGAGFLPLHDLTRWRVGGAVVALAGLAATVLCLLTLRAAGALAGPVSTRRQWISLLAGALLLVVVPVVLGIPELGRQDITSQVAYLVLFAAPWGLALAMCGALPAKLAGWSVATVLVSVAARYGAGKAFTVVLGHPGGWPLVQRGDLGLIGLALAVPVLMVAALVAVEHRDAQRLS
jgi:hypothetical protein